MLDHITIKNNTKGPVVLIAAVDPNCFDKPIGLEGKPTLLLAGEEVVFFTNIGVAYVLHHPDSRIKQNRVTTGVLRDGTIRTDVKDMTRAFDFDAAIKQRAEDDARRAAAEAT